MIWTEFTNENLEKAIHAKTPKFDSFYFNFYYKGVNVEETLEIPEGVDSFIVWREGKVKLSVLRENDEETELNLANPEKFQSHKVNLEKFKDANRLKFNFIDGYFSSVNFYKKDRNEIKDWIDRLKFLLIRRKINLSSDIGSVEDETLTFQDYTQLTKNNLLRLNNTTAIITDVLEEGKRFRLNKSVGNVNDTEVVVIPAVTTDFIGRQIDIVPRYEILIENIAYPSNDDRQIQISKENLLDSTNGNKTIVMHSNIEFTIVVHMLSKNKKMLFDMMINYMNIFPSIFDIYQNGIKNCFNTSKDNGIIINPELNVFNGLIRYEPLVLSYYLRKDDLVSNINIEQNIGGIDEI